MLMGACGIIDLIVVMKEMNAAHASGIELSHLRVLDLLLKTGSTVQAARALGLTQSAVSHALRRLREGLEDPLFVRVGRGLAPTERALGLRAQLAEALAAVERVFDRSEGFDPGSLRATFRIGGADYAELLVLPRLLPLLATAAPGVDVTVIAAGDAVEARLQRAELDLALGGYFEERAGLMLRPLLRDPFVVVCAPQHAPQELTLERYLAGRHVLVTPRGLPGGMVDERLAQLGLSRRVVARTPTFQTALALAARTELLATIPRSLAREFSRTTALTLLPPPLELPEVRFAALFAASRQGDRAHRWLRELIAGVIDVSR
jgi:DNA-binding transcriptional LysR family regulator